MCYASSKAGYCYVLRFLWKHEGYNLNTHVNKHTKLQASINMCSTTSLIMELCYTMYKPGTQTIMSATVKNPNTKLT